MCIQDVLYESIFSFYVELKCLKFIIEVVEDFVKIDGIFVFFFFDEILKGINFCDCYMGVKVFICQLIVSWGVGLIVMYDLELGVLEVEVDGCIENWVIEVDI